MALAKGSLIALLLTLAACCPGMIVDYPVYFDGGVPDGLTDASCAEYCAMNFPGPRLCRLRSQTCVWRPIAGTYRLPRPGNLPMTITPCDRVHGDGDAARYRTVGRLIVPFTLTIPRAA